MTTAFTRRCGGCPMSPDQAMRQVRVLGDGCAALSLAARADELAGHRLTLVRPQGAPQETDHIWGFWDGPNLAAASRLARKRWHSWSIVTGRGKAVLRSQERPYTALHRLDWTAHCRAAASRAGVATLDGDEAATATDLVFDSRPPPVPDGMMLQHFLGLEVRSRRAIFDPDTAILMDFRVDQSHGMHFIYLLPFSATEALVESTLFTPSVCPESYYRGEIAAYLEAHFGLDEFETLRTERGVIPLGILPRRDPSIPGIGGNGGAIRPSSGYAFPFIQKQIDRAIAAASEGRELGFAVPHRRVDLWMDAVLLTVLRHWPERAPELFLRMGRALDGDEFARFLSGEADWPLRLKVIMAMPKAPFLRGLVRLLAGSRPQRTAEAG
jgi:lycopene beta-cyclase